MAKKKIIDGKDMVEINPRDGSKYIRLKGKNVNMPTIEIKEVKIIGKLQDTFENIELLMSKKVFFEWINKLRKSTD